MRTLPVVTKGARASALIAFTVIATACGVDEPGSDPVSPTPAIAVTASTAPPQVELTVPPETSTGVPVSTIALASIDLGSISVCDRLLAADFTDNDWREYLWRDQSSIEVYGDDYVDRADAACIEDTIRVIDEDPHGNYPIIELSETNGEITAQELLDDDVVIPLVVSNVDVWSGELTLLEVGPDLEEARNAGVNVVAALLNADAETFVALLNDELIWFDDDAATTPTEIMGFAEEDGFPWGDGRADHTLREYLFEYIPTVAYLDDTALTDPTKALLLDISGGTDVVIYDGAERRNSGSRFQLGTDLGRFALMMTSAGWRVIAL